ncbi:siderophore-interacting protein [Ureibacillus suwonensis]|jgi:NADPH-dependent ferric siderophore reductase|uniref:Siderophore-interacting protein n=1 Tax=Ureibacillus suwonensis TaxID=313007 RepID=A0ABW0RC92_9BACL
MGIIEKLAKSLATHAKVVNKIKVAEHTFKLSIRLQEPNAFSYRPQDFLRILVGTDQQAPLRDRVRSYSIWNFDAQTQTLDLAVCTFSNGPGAKWINNVNMGDDVYFMKHSSNLIIHDDAADAVMIGDITALGHFYGLRRLFRNQNRVSGFIFGQNQADFFPDIDGHSPFEFITTSPQQYQTVISSVEASLPQPTNNTTIYVAGDGEMCKLLHKHLKDELGWNSKQIRAKPFWIHGKKGLE